MKVGFIGLGNMGASLARAVAQVPDVTVLLSQHNLEKAKAVQADIGGELMTNSYLVSQADVIFLGVKPQQVPIVLEELEAVIQKRPEVIWVSMAAGLTLAQLANYLPTQRLVRIMPNTPVAIGQGMTTLSSHDAAAQQLVQDLLAASGKVFPLPEAQMDAATAIAGCGPAFVYTFIEALADAGVAHGLPRQLALELAGQTLVGAGQLTLESSDHPAQLRDAVCSPGGATIAGVLALEEHGFRHATQSAVTAALHRTKALSSDA